MGMMRDLYQRSHHAS